MTVLQLIAFITLSSSVYSDKLLRLILVVSNGEMTPPIALDNSVWEEGLNQLTQEGMEQGFLNGIYIRDTYTDPASPLYLLDTEYHKNMIEVQSSPKDANLMSTETFLRGMYYKDTEMFEDTLLLRPVPIYESEYLDIIDCIGRREISVKEEMATWDIISFWGQNQDKIYDLYNKVGYHGVGINMLEQLYQVMTYQERFELPQEKALVKYADMITQGHQLIWESKLYWSIDSTRALAGKALSELTTRISECSTGTCSTEELLLIYTCSVDTLAWIQSALGYYTGQQPLPSTILQLEVWESASRDVYVKVKQTHANVTSDIAIANCTTECPAVDFIRRAELYSATEEDLDTLCADADYLLKLLTERTTTVLISTGGVFVIFGIALYLVRGKSSAAANLETEKTRWSKLLQDDDGF